MAVHSEDVVANMSVKQFFEKEVEDWRSEMIKVYADQHPYIFYVTAGHDFEDLILKREDCDSLVRELKKFKPFENLKKMSEVDKKAAMEFQEILLQMAKEKPTPDLKQSLEEKKKECVKVFEIFDQVVSVCEDYFELEYSDCRKRVSKQMMLQEPIINEVEKFLIQVEEVGNTELKFLRDRISKFVYGKGRSMLNSVEKSYSALSNQPFAMAIWFECTAALTSKDVHKAFLTDQKEMSSMWKKAFDDLLMLSTELEKCRCNYNLIKFKLEREIFWMSRDYKENMPELTKIQRHLSSLIDQKVTLKLEMRNLENETESEQKRLAEMQSKIHEKTVRTKNSNRKIYQCALKQFENSVHVKKDEIFSFLGDILKGDQFIHEEILGIHWDPVDLSQLKSEDNDEHADLKDKILGIASAELENRNKILNFACEDKFSEAFQILISSENFETLLNSISRELNYMLDFTWVDYIKNKLELTQEVKWLELFKVFKVNFVEDLRELEEHMMSYCKFDNMEEVVFDINKAVDGFLNFVWLKRQTSHATTKHNDFGSENYEDYWASAKNVIPKSLLWESVEEILIQYWKLLEDRSTLLKEKLNLVTANEELENYLKNYRKYGTWCV